MNKRTIPTMSVALALVAVASASGQQSTTGTSTSNRSNSLAPNCPAGNVARSGMNTGVDPTVPGSMNATSIDVARRNGQSGTVTGNGTGTYGSTASTTNNG